MGILDHLDHRESLGLVDSHRSRDTLDGVGFRHDLVFQDTVVILHTRDTRDLVQLPRLDFLALADFPVQVSPGIVHRAGTQDSPEQGQAGIRDLAVDLDSQDSVVSLGSRGLLGSVGILEDQGILASVGFLDIPDSRDIPLLVRGLLDILGSVA